MVYVETPSTIPIHWFKMYDQSNNRSQSEVKVFTDEAKLGAINKMIRGSVLNSISLKNIYFLKRKVNKSKLLT